MAKKKDDFSLGDFTDLGDLSGGYGSGYGDIPDFGGGGDINWNDIIGQQPENGSFVGPGGTDPNGYTPGDYTDENAFNTGLDSGGGGMGGSGNPMQSLIRMLTGSSGGGSGMGALGALLPFLASIGGGLMQRNATRDATHQIQDSLANANQQVTSLLGGAQATYKPYMDAGLGALGKLQAFPQSNLAGQFKPIGSGKGLNLSQIVKGS